MDRQFISRFLEKYKSLPCLWKIKSEEYKNKSLRCSAYNELLVLTKEYYREADLDYVKKKINNLRTTFRKEFKKYHRSIGSSSEIYTPTLWYFDLLYFVEDQEMELNDDEDGENSINNSSVEFPINFSSNLQGSTEKQSSFYIQGNDPLEDENEDISKNNSMSKIMNSPTHQEIPESQQPQEPCSRKRPNDYSYCNQAKVRRNDNVFQSHSNYPPSNHSNQMNNLNCACREDSFGTYVAARLKNMEKYQRIYAEHVISNVLFHGALQDLTANSTVNNLDNTHRIRSRHTDKIELSSLDIKTEVFDQTI